jgi:TolB-like protein/Tfp pilus assembly protein PilF
MQSANSFCIPIGSPRLGKDVRWRMTIGDQHNQEATLSVGVSGSDVSSSSVFLSYSRQDQKLALPILHALQSAGFVVWWDGMLEGGERFADTTEAVLESAKAVVVLWSKTSIKSHWVHDEATRGRDRKCLVPVSLDGSEPPLGFRQFQVIDASKSKVKSGGPEIEKLLRAVCALHNRETISAPIERRNGPLIGRRGVIAGAALAALGAGGTAAWYGGLLGESVNRSSIAVLPFANLSGDPDQSYFSDGLSEELRNMLNRSRQIEVAAATSSNSFVDKNVNAKDIARKLDVAYILDGSVRRAGDTVRISAQLIDGDTGFEKWSQSLDRTMTDIFAVQSEIATYVADALAVRLQSGSGTQPGVAGGTDDSKAYDAYLRGKALYRLAASESTDRQALAQFNAAIKRDDNYAAAFAAKSRAITVIANSYAKGAELRGLYDQSVAAARQAIALAPDFAEAQSALGFVLFNGRLDVKSAQSPYQKSYELGFGNADILSAYANFAGRIGAFVSARDAIIRAKRLDPLNASVIRNAGIIEFCAHNYDAAAQLLQSALALNPKSSATHATLGDIATARGQARDALAFYKAESLPFERLKGIAIAAMKLGQMDEAQKAFAELTTRYGSSSQYQIGQVLTQWGNQKGALDALDQALALGDSGLVQSRNDPLLDPLRSSERFKAILAKLGFATNKI